MSISRDFLRTAWIPLVAVVLVTGAAEALFRAAGIRPSDDQGGLYAAFGDGKYRLRPNVTTSASWRSGWFSVHTDELGLRCGAHGEGALKDETRADVLLLGDSQCFGQGVEFEDSIAGTLWAREAAEGRTVANASIGGHLLGDQVQLLADLRGRHGLRASTIVVLVTPRMIAYDGGHDQVVVGDDGRVYGEAPGAWMRVQEWLKTHAAAYIVARDAVATLTDSAKKLDERVELYESGPVESERAASITAEMRQVEDAVGPDGTEVVLVYVPFSIEFDSRSAAVNFEVPLRILRHVGESLHVRVIDLHPALEKVRDEGQPVHLKADAHYGPAASKACGELIWSDLRAHEPPRKAH